MYEWPKQNDVLGTVNRGTPCESGLCTLCRADCKGKCETWMSSLVGRKLLYPRDFGSITSGSGNSFALGAGYHSVRIQGHAWGAGGLKPGVSADADGCIFPNVSTEVEFGVAVKTRCRIPLMTGALGSTFIATKYWESFAAGAALVGIPIVVGENVVGVDKLSTLKDGKVSAAPELDRRIEVFKRYADGYGTVIVQLNVEDTRCGVAEYIAGKHGDDVMIELKWGQGAKDIGGEIMVTDIEYARFLKARGYIVDPDPNDPVVEQSYRSGGVRAFARHSRLGGASLHSAQAVKDDFLKAVAHLRSLGFKRISLKTGAYGMEALALAIRCASDGGLDLLTIDGAGGGTGMSPWNMMDHWGVTSLGLHQKAWEYCQVLKEQGRHLPAISFGGGFAREDHVFKALALGAPFSKLVCMGRAPMIPGYLGSNIQGVLQPEKKAAVNGNWDALPPTVNCYGETPEKIFASWEGVKARIGAQAMKDVPWGAVAMVAWADKIACGLQQFMAGARCFDLAQLRREDLMAANEETARLTKLPLATEAQETAAQAVLLG
jgi:hypothetical protein